MPDDEKKSQVGDPEATAEAGAGDEFEFGKFDEAELVDEAVESDDKESPKKSKKSSKKSSSDGGRKPPSSNKKDLKKWAKEELKKRDEEDENTKSANAASAKKDATDGNEASRSVAEEVDDSGDASKVEAEVCEVFFDWTDCWNKGNLFGYLDAYWESDQTRYISEGLATGPHAHGGIVITGRREIDKVFTDVFIKMKNQQEKQKVKKGVAGYLTLRKLIVTPTGMNNAIVFGENQLEVAGDKRGHRGGVFTIHVRKTSGKWKIVSEHHTELPK